MTWQEKKRKNARPQKMIQFFPFYLFPKKVSFLCKHLVKMGLGRSSSSIWRRFQLEKMEIDQFNPVGCWKNKRKKLEQDGIRQSACSGNVIYVFSNRWRMLLNYCKWNKKLSLWFV